MDEPEGVDAAPAAYGMAAMGAFSLPGPARPSALTEGEGVTVAETLIAGMDAALDPTGALFWRSAETLVVSDLHLETGSSYARTGQMLPPYDTALTLTKLEEAVARYQPRRIVSLGDSFHDPRGVERLGEEARARLTRVIGNAEMVWVTGNHEGDSAARLGGHCVDVWRHADVVFRHIPLEGPVHGHEVAGHLHPAARIVVRGRTLRRRCFVGCTHRMVMPAFGSYTGGLSVADPAFAALWPEPPGPKVHLIGTRRVYSI